MKKLWDRFGWFVTTVLGSATFGLSFAIFLAPNGMNGGGISGLAQSLLMLFGGAEVAEKHTGLLTILINLPLFAIGGLKIGKRFFFGSLVGLSVSSLLMDYFPLAWVPTLQDPLLGAIFGGMISGIGLGFVFMSGTSTGGSDIVVRLVKLKAKNLPIGQIALIFDLIVVILTAIAYGDFNNALYTAITVFLCDKMIDAVAYGFDYSNVALIISKEYARLPEIIDAKLGRGSTYLYSQGTYSKTDNKVVLVAVKRKQINDLKELVAEIDPDAFVILQEAHQVLGDGFAKHTKDSL